MALEKLGESLGKVIRRITLAGLVDEKLVREVVRELQRALLSADVNVKLVMELSRKVQERALKEKPPAGLSRKEHTIRVLYEELVNLLGGGDGYTLPQRARIMLVGLQGSGKTTTVAKLARYFQKRGLSVTVIAADTHRPAAYEQLSQLVEPLHIRVLGSPHARDAVEVVKEALPQAEKSDIVILDTAGRHRSEEELFSEMVALAEVFQPDEKFLVIDSNLGQQAGAQARAFNEHIGITGVVLTKLDGSARGGGALSAVAETGAPIRFVGTGEGTDALEVFDAERFISRLLGMGDLQSLLEKAKETIDEQKAREIFKGEFTLEDLYAQIESLNKMGPLASVMRMIPGLGMALPQEAAELTEARMRRFLVIMDSMTREERQKPRIINSSRMRRIALGSGAKVEEVKELLKYYNTMKRALKSLKKGRGRGMRQLARLMRGMGMQ
ncbi:MAG: signal recognition particle protein [Euryarchaeota archaeon]|nr:signal recognition particle protein [Euryarchaeota archaeon]